MRWVLARKALRFLGLLFASSPCIAADRASADCVDYKSHTHWLTSVEVEATDRIVPFGDYAMLHDRIRGFQIYDLAEPLRPRFVSSLDCSGIRNCDVAEERAYLVGCSSDLTVVCLANPALPWALGGVDTPGVAADVAVSGSFAYVADTNLGLRAVDISDPANPELVASLPLDGEAPHQSARRHRVRRERSELGHSHHRCLRSDESVPHQHAGD